MRLSSRPPMARIMRIDQAVRAGTWPNATTLAEALEVTPKTVRRDITYMRDQLLAPLEYDPARFGYFYRDPSFRLPYFQVTEGELVALLLAERILRQYRGTPFEADLRRAFARVTEALTDQLPIRLDTMADCLAVLPDSRIDYDPEVFAALARAAVGRRRVEMVYWTAGRGATTRRVFDPYGLLLADEGWFAVGHCHLRNQVLVFAAQRVRSVRETGESFDVPAGFRVEDYMAGSFRTVRGGGQFRVALRFTPAFAGRIVERTWHRSQSVEWQPDGGLVLRFEVSDLREVKRWVMFWGSDCEALEPAELRSMVGAEIRDLGRLYGNESARSPYE
jgi:proteasome accessory factor B